MTAAAAQDFADTTLIGRRRAKSLAGARRRSGVVRALRIVLLAAIGLIILNAAVQVLVSGRGAPDQPVITLTGGERIINPRFTGRDADGRPFVVTALSATRRGGGLGAIADLESPALDYALVDLDADRASSVLAAAGVYDETEETLLLRQDVELSTRSGYAFSTEEALIHLDEGMITGNEGVYGEAPWGAVYAGRFEVRDEGRRIVLEDGVRTRLYVDDTAEETAP